MKWKIRLIKSMPILFLAAVICLVQAGCSCGNGNAGTESSYNRESTSGTESTGQIDLSENSSSAGPVGGGTIEGVIYVPGTYTGTAQGYAGPIDVTVDVDETHILSVRAAGPSESEGIGQVALEKLPDKIVEANGTHIDVISGATFSSQGLLAAVEEALTKAMTTQ